MQIFADAHAAESEISEIALQPDSLQQDSLQPDSLQPDSLQKDLRFTDRYDFNIPQQPLATALIVYARQADLTLIVPFADIQGHESSPVVGFYTAQDAIMQLLEGTELSANLSGLFGATHRSITITDRAHLTNDKSAQTDPGAMQQTEITDESEPRMAYASTLLHGPRNGDRIAWLGVRQQYRGGLPHTSAAGSGVARRVYASNAPLSALGSVQLQRIGHVESPRLLTENFAALNQTGSAPGSAPGSATGMRGLSPAHMLVMVNGKSLHRSAGLTMSGYSAGSSGARLDMIPAVAIESAQVLGDGASAHYGSGAVAGAIDIRLHQRKEGGRFNIELGRMNNRVSNRDVGDSAISVSAQQGFALGDGYMTLSGEYVDRESPMHSASATGQSRKSLLLNFAAPITGASAADASAANANGINRIDEPHIYGHLGFADNRYHRPISDTQDVAATLGAAGRTSIFDVPDLRYDISVNFGRNELRTNRSFGEQGIDFNLMTPDQLADDRLRYQQTTLNVDMARDFPAENAREKAREKASRKAQTTRLAFGAELRRESFAGKAAVDGAHSPEATRDGYALYVELDQDYKLSELLGLKFQQTTGVDTNAGKLSMTGALRVDGYSARGSDSLKTRVSAKLAARLGLTNSWSVRASQGRAFRAPSLQQIAHSLSAVALQSETARHSSLGIGYRSSNDVSFGIDTFRIRIDDRLLLSGPLFGADSGLADSSLADSSLADSSLVHGGQRFGVMVNGADTVTDGFDINAAWRIRRPGDELQIRASHSVSDTHLRRITDRNLCHTGQSVARLLEGLPESKTILGLDWARNFRGRELLLSARARRLGGYQDTAVAFPGVASRVKAEWLLDTDVSYRLSEQLTISAGANNLFDSDQLTEGLTALPQNPLSGLGGRYLYTRASFKF